MENRRTPGLAPGGTTTEGGPAVNDAFATAENARTGDATTSVVRRFPAACVSVRAARHFLLEHLRGNGDEDLDPLALMLSELATNAVEHADTAFEVGIAVTPEAQGRSVQVRVTDEAPGFPVPQQPAPDRPRGRGLRIVESLADAWGIEVQHGHPGKTVWFTSRLEPASPSDLAVDPVGQFRWDDEHEVGLTVGATAHDAVDPAQGFEAWPIPGVRSLLDCLNDGVIATDEQGVIHYANVAAEDLLGWPHGSLRGRSGLELVPAMAGPSQGGFATFMRTQADRLAGRRLPAVVKSAAGSEVHVEVVLSIFEHPVAGRVVVGIFRRRDERRMQRWSELTSELLELLAAAPIDDPPAERLLATLGRRLDWDVTTLWTLGRRGRLVCRHVWTRTPRVAPSFAKEKAADATSGSEGLPRWVLEHGEPVWLADLAHDEQFAGDGLVRHGFKSAYAFPIRYRGEVVGIVKMLSTRPASATSASSS